ncbi:MAG: gamma carbonic anhydrase family protein [Geobacteraceae bacterium]|nr:gamma carbonic anhydrase family protein [Geobacteraceae bacterium]
MIRPFKGIIPKVDPSSFIAETAVVIGDVEIGPLSSIWYNTVVRGDVNHVRIGKGTNIQDLSILHVTHRKEPQDPGAPLNIGDFVTIAHGVTLHGCTILNGAFIGMQAVVMDNVVIGEESLVGARALVTEGTIIAPRTLWLGSPARYKRDLTAEELERLRDSAQNYIRYAEDFRNG